MARLSRYFVEGQPQYPIQRGNNREPIIIDSEAYLLTCMRYIELNPVRAGMVEDPSDYPWSSNGANALGAYDKPRARVSLNCRLEVLASEPRPSALGAEADIGTPNIFPARGPPAGENAPVEIGSDYAPLAQPEPEIECA